MKVSYLSEKEVKSKIGDVFAKEKVSFYGWKIHEVRIFPTGFDAATLIVNTNLKKEIEIDISSRCIPRIYIRDDVTKEIKQFTSLREALAY